MLGRYDQAQLLDLIEGHLDQGAAEALRRQLARDPASAATVESMIRDRAALRLFDEPALPQDFIAAIEPMLSRPMLIEPVAELPSIRPGEFRRQHRRRIRSMRLGRLAAAAAVVLTAAGGTWAIIESLTNTRVGTGDGSLAFENTAAGSDAGAIRHHTPLEPGALVASNALGPGTVHHDPRPGAGRDVVIAAVGTHGTGRSSAASGADSGSRGQPTLLAADFVVVLHSAGAMSAEASITSAIADLGERAALVRNFSFAEAQRLSEEYRMAHGGTRPDSSGSATDQPMADVAPGVHDVREHVLTGEQMRQLAMQVREQLRLRMPAAAQSPERSLAPNSGLLAGATGLAPTLEQQLDFSSRGATHTIAIPASDLVALVESLALADPSSGTTTLRMLPVDPSPAHATVGASASSPAAATMAWLTEGPRVRQALQRLSRADSDAIILLPVLVQ